MLNYRFRIVCLSIIFILCFSLVGCDLSSDGLLGELMEDLSDELKEPVGELSSMIGKETEQPEQPAPEQTRPSDDTAEPTPDTEKPTVTEPPVTDPPVTEPPVTEPPVTEPPVTEPPVTEPPVVYPDPVLTFSSFDECDMWIDGVQTDAFFAPGQANSWEGYGYIDDYNVQYLRVWGWVGFYSENIGEFGYQIDNEDPVFDPAFTWEAEQAVIEASKSSGAKSASRFKIMIPVEYLSGEHEIYVLVKDAAGTVEVFEYFYINKSDNPNAPVFFVPAADMASSMPGSPDIADASLSADGSYIRVTTGQVGDPYYQLPMINQKGYVASYVAIKYRTTVKDLGGEIFVGSGAGPCGLGDNITYDMIADGNWQLVIIDLSRATAVVDGVINYLRWDAFRMGTDNVIDLAYIAAFHSIEAAEAYDLQFADVYRNVPYHEDMTISLGVRTSGGPFVGGHKNFGQRMDLGDNFLKQITIDALATYADGNQNSWLFTIWQWNGSYEATVSSTPLYEVSGENHQDNTNFTLDVPANLLIDGDIYYELLYRSGSGSFTGWEANDPSPFVETYVAGQLKEGTYASSVVVGVEKEPPETVYYDGTNGEQFLPAGGECIFFVRNVSGKTLIIKDAFNFAVTADDLMGTVVALQPDANGTISVEIPEGWDSMELTFVNTANSDAVINLTLAETIPSSPDLEMGDNLVYATVTTDYWNEIVYRYFTAPEAGTYTFTLSKDYAAGSLFFFDAPTYGLCEDNTITLSLEKDQTIELGVCADLIFGDLAGATEDLVYTLLLSVSQN